MKAHKEGNLNNIQSRPSKSEIYIYLTIETILTKVISSNL